MKLPRRMLRNGWTLWHFIGAGVMTLFALWMTFPAWESIYTIAAEPGSKSRHVFLVPVIAAWLIWVRRRRILHCRPHGHWIGLVLIFLGGVLFSLSTQFDFSVDAESTRPDVFGTMLWHLGAVGITVGCMLILLGIGVAQRFLPAVLVLAFLVPIPDPICDEVEYPVKVATLELTVGVYNLVGMDAGLDFHNRQPNEPPRILLNGVAPSRDDAYHGLPMVFDLFLVSWAFVFGSPLRGSVRVIILLLSPLSAVFCGAAGLMATLWLYGNPVMLSQADMLHQLGAWAMLLLAFLLLTAVIRALTWASVPVRHYTLAYDM